MVAASWASPGCPHNLTFYDDLPSETIRLEGYSAEGAKAAKQFRKGGVRMSKKRSSGALSVPPQGAGTTIPGAVGGPSTGRGMNYQIDYAVLKALELIPRSLCVPFRTWAIHVEPRAGGPGGATQWDLAVESPRSLIEAKLNPTREDLLDWLDRAVQGATATPGPRFVLVYSKGGGVLLPSLEKLIRNAGEAAGNAQKFRDLLSMETIAEAPLLLSRMGKDPHLFLRRAALEFIPEGVLKENTEMRAGLLAGGADASRLLDFLFHKFMKAVPQRATFPVRDLVAEITTQRIPLSTPPTVDATGLPGPTAAALVMLQVCQDGLPLEVMACAVPCSEEELLAGLEALPKEEVVSVHGGVWSIRPLPGVVPILWGPDVVARALQAILDYVAVRKNDSACLGLVRNVIALAKRCISARPAVVQNIYQPFEKLLKRKGDKHLVLEVADLAIEAARRSVRGEGEVKAEAQALICGRSWVYQRIGRLGEARVVAERSLELGEQVGWKRNTAFCKKCIGRLLRMEAEKLPAGPERNALLDESIVFLKDALQRFRTHPEFGPSDPEVGECHSLLGRTHYVAGRLAQTKACIAKAKPLLLDPNDKDYLDLAILKGDLAAEEGERDRADGCYEEAVGPAPPGDAERSEIRGRALYQRGVNRAAGGQEGAAVHDFQEASDIWNSLGEHRAAARPAWEAIRLDAAVPQALLRRLEHEAIEIRVAAVEAYRRKLAVCGGTVPPALAAARREACDQCIAEARSWVAANIIDW